jgi:nucleoside transporter
MMFLEFFIWGGWFVTLGSYLARNLSATGAESAMAFSTQSWGAIIAPFIIGLIADRWVNAERLLGAIHLVGALLMARMATVSDFSSFYPTVLAYMIIYMPTLALVNAVSFRQMRDPAREFGPIRFWGTLGWIVAGLAISYVFHWDSSEALAAGALRNTFMMCAVASAALGLFSFTLPATPPVPQAAGGSGLRQALGLDALALLKDRNYLVFFVCSILVCIPLAFYYQYANSFLVDSGIANPTGKQTFGQMSELAFMLLLPVFLKRIGMKGTLLVGMLAWALRYALFAWGDGGAAAWMLILGIVLHGVCYDFFFVSGQVYTDARAGESHRSAAQGLITLATYGVGMLVGFNVAGRVADAHVVGAGHDWRAIWIIPAVFAVVIAALFGIAFRNEKVGAPGQG